MTKIIQENKIMTEETKTKKAENKAAYAAKKAENKARTKAQRAALILNSGA